MSETDRMRAAYVKALTVAWAQANYVSARGVDNSTAIVSNIEECFKEFVPDWREASAEAAGRDLATVRPAPQGEVTR